MNATTTLDQPETAAPEQDLPIDWTCRLCGKPSMTDEELKARLEALRYAPETQSRPPAQFVCQRCEANWNREDGLREWRQLKRLWPWLATAPIKDIAATFKAQYPSVPWAYLEAQDAGDPTRLLAAVGVPVAWQAASFETCADAPTNVVDAMKAFASEPGGMLLLTGISGSGKTWLTVSTLRAVVTLGRLPTTDVAFVGEAAYLDSLREGFDDSRRAVSDVLLPTNHPRRVKLLALDDLGSTRLTNWGRAEIGNLLEKRYADNLPTIITTNLSLAEIDRQIDPRLTSRIGEGGQVFDLPAIDLRLKRTQAQRALQHG